jgi:hypothetical protein
MVEVSLKFVIKLYFICVMRRTKKFLRFEDMHLVVTEEHPKDVSRAQLRVIDVANNN